MTGFTAIPSGVRRLLLAHGLSATAMGLPWPALLVAVWEHTHDGAALGLAGAARMAPYVLLSWLAGRVADRVARGRIVKASLALRLGLLAGTAVCLSSGYVTAAVVCACLVVAAGTPAYPALAAEMPTLAGASNEAATGLLVTFEVAAFFVGPALGGVALSLDLGLTSAWAGVAFTAAAFWMVFSLSWTCRDGRLPSEAETPTSEGVLHLLLRQRVALVAVVAVVVNNAVLGAVGIALLPLAEQEWRGDARQFGVATAALGVGAFAAPALLRLWGLGGPAGRRSAAVLGAVLAGLAVSPGLWWALAPLAVIGAAAVYVEAVATALIQGAAPNRACSSVLGLADSLMVAAGAIGAAVTPWLTEQWDVRLVLVGCGIGSVCMVALFPRWGDTQAAAASFQVLDEDGRAASVALSDR